MTVEVDFLQANAQARPFEADVISKAIVDSFHDQYFTIGQMFVADVAGSTLKFTVLALTGVTQEELKDLVKSQEFDFVEENKTLSKRKGYLVKESKILCVKAPGSSITLTGEATRGGAGVKFVHDWNFEKMGIGGLDAEFSDIFRRAFASRIFSPSFINKLGIKHVKGILLYGPPGTGKTLMARQIGKMLNGKEPKVVSGPEILNKYVGQSEENVRLLFADAEAEYQQKGDESDLHIIILDEVDAICSQRGSRTGGTGVSDTVVNQLLSKIDGVNSLNNILVIGMTNRKDMIDEALLRAGRLEVHMEIGLPDEAGRLQIFKIHTQKMRENNLLTDDVDLKELAANTRNYSGAEIEGVVKSATSFAFDRQIDVNDPTKPIDQRNVKITKDDFRRALEEVVPSFGVSADQFASCVPNGIIEFSDEFRGVVKTAKLLLQQVKNSDVTPVLSVLLEGSVGSGKTALAATLAMNSNYPYVKLITPEDFLRHSESVKRIKIDKYFQDAYKSPLSLIVVDDIERLLEYVPIGPRFSNMILQSLLVLFKKAPPPGRKLLVIATTSNREVLEAMQILDVFTEVLTIPDVSSGDQTATVLRAMKNYTEKDIKQISEKYSGKLPIKKLMTVADMAIQDDDGTSLADRFLRFAGSGSHTVPHGMVFTGSDRKKHSWEQEDDDELYQFQS
eukprot:CAMPEP_0174254514 /NCGR_PEP_ID=MMETSP0439-20130205/3822_1 /TAXON_ID=0 /ORGANISM="Stereomyxa ramosa, Strain Chinc5" /LENGTH=676 /DNA_ID=CAMNT_0015336137 /DNA_START=493 /DNA_END=2523 /DNA_ORIENTATION=-